MSRMAVVVSEGDVTVGSRPWVFGVGIYESTYHSMYGEYNCAVAVIKQVFAGSDVEILPCVWGSNKVHAKVYTKDRTDFYNTSFHYKTVSPVIDFYDE